MATSVVAIPGSEDHAGKLARALGVELVEPELRRFPDGELYVRLPKAAEHVVLCGSLYPAPAERFMELALIAGTARDLGAKRVGLVAPYLAFMRQDAAFADGEGVTARYFARLVSGVIDWMVTVDPHLHRLPSLANVYTIPTAVARAAPAIAEWVRGPVGHKHNAEYFLFQDEDDFPFVCRSAGLNPESVRESLWAIRAQFASQSATKVA